MSKHINANPCLDHNTPFCLPCGYTRAAAELQKAEERIGFVAEELRRQRELNVELVARTIKVSQSFATRTYRIEIGFDPRIFHEGEALLHLLHEALDRSARRGWYNG